jgi:uncharacterized protein (TIGR02598 family)
VEVTIALGVAAFCLIAILGLLQTGLTSEKDTVGRTAAWGMLSAVHSDLLSTSPTNSTSPIFKLALSGGSLSTPQTIYFSEAGQPTGSVGSGPTSESRYRVSIGIQSTAVNSPAPATVRLLATWPAAADPLPGSWPSRASGSFEVMTTLDRN